jgi:hypothetical protein
MVFFRLAQGHEIDSIKTGTKYEIAGYYNNIKLPYFLIYRYPKEKSFLQKIKKENKQKKKSGQQEDRYNVLFAHSPMNELCWDIEKWQTKILSNFQIHSDNNTYKLFLNNNVTFNDKDYWIVKELYNEFNKEYKELLKEHKGDEDLDKIIVSFYDSFKAEVNKLNIPKSELTNYCVLASYVKDEKDIKKDNAKIEKMKKQGKTARIHDKSTKFAWIVIPDEMIKNLKNNSPINNNIIVECGHDDENVVEYLGRYYKLITKEDEVFVK